MHIHDVADDERSAFMATQNAGRKRPRHLQVADVLSGDLLELRVTLVGIISCRHHPIFWVLRHSDQLIVGMSSARSEDRYGAHASAEQEIAHRFPPCDSTAGERRDSTRCAASRHPFDLSGLRPTRLSRIRQDPRVPTFLKPELKRKSIAATNLRNEKIASGWVQLSRVYFFCVGQWTRYTPRIYRAPTDLRRATMAWSVP